MPAWQYHPRRDTLHEHHPLLDSMRARSCLLEALSWYNEDNENSLTLDDPLPERIFEQTVRLLLNQRHFNRASDQLTCVSDRWASNWHDDRDCFLPPHGTYVTTAYERSHYLSTGVAQGQENIFARDQLFWDSPEESITAYPEVFSTNVPLQSHWEP